MTTIAWGHDTGTRELPRILPAVPAAEPPTVEMGVLDLPPAVDPTRRDRITRALRAVVVAIVAVDLVGVGYVLATQL